MSAQLDRVQALAAERIANEELYPFQREYNQTFSDILCYLIGAGAISDEALTTAIELVHAEDARTVAQRASKAVAS